VTVSYLPSSFRAAAARNLSSSRASVHWRWLPLLLSPFAFGAMIKLFPLDNVVAVTLIIGVLGLFAALGSLATVFGWRAAPTGAASAVLLCCLSLPFWSLRSDTPDPSPANPVFSYKDAKANPDAFAKWWQFFGSEVARISVIVQMPDPLGRLPHVLRPGATTRFVSGSVAVNDLGYRGDNFPREKDENFRIVAIGASPTFGQTVFPDSRPWPAVLDELIRQRLQCRRSVQVINGGVNSYALEHGIERLDRDMAWLIPDMVLSNFGWNDRLNIGVNPKWLATVPQGPPEAAPSEAGRASLVLWLLRRAGRTLLADIKGAVGRLAAIFEKSDRAAMMKEAREGKLYREYQRLIDQARRNEFALVFLSVSTAVLPESPERAKAFYRAIFRDVDSAVDLMRIHNRMLEELAGQHPGVYFADTSPGLAGRFDDGLYLDVVHFTTAGDVAMANNAYRRLEPLLMENVSLACQRR